MKPSYAVTKTRLASYFDDTAHQAWRALTSDAPVSRIRATVRAGRDEMRAALLAMLPADLSGTRVLDAGCGAGQMAQELAARGAEVIAVDISPRLVELAATRTPASLRERICFRAGDMLDPSFGEIDHVVAMDSLIHYRVQDIAAALDRLCGRTRGAIVFTAAPKTPLLAAMHVAGKAFPRKDRSPQIIPVSNARLARALKPHEAAGRRVLRVGPRISRGFYISQAYALSPAEEGAR
ncbi:MAG: magnesium protoporphyrin IX methyltransferase [Pseudomonadota bacterium]